MKKGLLFGVLLCGYVWFVACDKEDSIEEVGEARFFLSELRPEFFNHLNFSSSEMRNQIPKFLSEYKEMYTNLRMEYDAGKFTSPADKNHIGIAAMYTSFGLTAITRGYLDKFVQFSEIIGDANYGLYSGLPITADDFEYKELSAMMDESNKAARFGTYVNGFNDKIYGSYIVSRQIRERVRSRTNMNSHIAHDSTVEYMGSTINDYDFFASWNSLMTQLSFTNYRDSLNTFKNPKMNDVLAILNTRMTTTAIPDLNKRYAEVIGPIMRFDTNLKRVDWLLNHNDVPNQDDREELDMHIAIMIEQREHVLGKKKALLNDWDYQYTLMERFDVLQDLLDYREQLDVNPNAVFSVSLYDYFNTKDFLQAYQCYNCHNPVSL